MKILNKLCLAILVIALGLFTACSPSLDDISYNAGGFIIFTQSAASVGDGAPGGGNTVTVNVRRGGTADYSAAVTVNYSITATFADGSDASGSIVDNGGGSVTIPADAISSSFELQTVGNGTLDNSDVTVTVAMTSVSDASLNTGFPGPDALSSTFVLTIIDDDCPYDLANYLGEFTAVDASFPNSSYTVTIEDASTVDNPNRVRIIDFYGFSTFAGFTAVVFADLDPATGTFTIPVQQVFTTTGGPINGAAGPLFIEPIGTPAGTFATCITEMNTDYRMYFDDGASGATYENTTVTYTN